MTDRYIETERRLAELLGWTDIVDVPPCMVGRPPNGHPECRGQAMVPRWCRDWGACGPLMVEHQVEPMYFRDFVVMEIHGVNADCDAHYKNHEDRDTAVRYAIVQSVIALLEAA
jgi:hypothetical protein